MEAAAEGELRRKERVWRDADKASGCFVQAWVDKKKKKELRVLEASRSERERESERALGPIHAIQKEREEGGHDFLKEKP